MGWVLKSPGTGLASGETWGGTELALLQGGEGPVAGAQGWGGRGACVPPSVPQGAVEETR